MATDKEIEAAVLKYLNEQAYGSNTTDGLAIAAEASYGLILAERDRLRGEVATLRVEHTTATYERGNLLGVLREIQWRGSLHADGDPVCPFCFQTERQGHRTHCDLGNVLAHYSVPADARGEVMYDVQMTADEAAEIDARLDARGEVDRLREALRFYAEGRHFEVDDPPQEENNIYLLEHGEHARAALAAVPADAQDKGEER